MKKIIYLSGAILLLSGCSLMPNYIKPATVADTEQLIKTGAVTADQRLWLHDVFNKHRPLTEMLNRALRNNDDWQTSILKLKSARSQTFSDQADLPPALWPSPPQPAGLTTSTALFTGATIRQKSNPNPSAPGSDVYEVDIWGRKSGENSRLMHTFAWHQHRLSAVRLTLQAELASTWFETLSLIKIWHIYQEKRSLLAPIERRIKTFHRHDRLAKEKYAAFFSDKNNDAKAIHAIEKNIAFNLDKIEYLSGFVSPWLNHANWKTIKPDFSVPDIPQAITSHVIFNRPDVLAAEEAIKSANGSIGAARAAFLPVVNLYGEAWHPSDSFNDIIDNLTDDWSLFPTVTLPLASWPQYYADLQQAETEQEIALANYKDAVANALLDLKEASDALNRYRSQLSDSEKALAQHMRSFKKISQQYARGHIDLYRYYEAVNILATAKIEAASNRKLTMDNVIIVLKAMGG